MLFFELNEGVAAWKDNMTVIKTEMNYRFEMSDKDYTSFYDIIFTDLIQCKCT